MNYGKKRQQKAGTWLNKQQRQDKAYSDSLQRDFTCIECSKLVRQDVLSTSMRHEFIECNENLDGPLCHGCVRSITGGFS